MFADNNKISGRQCARMLFFDFLGIGTLILPGYLAQMTGEDGIWAILAGTLLALLYLKLLGKLVLNTEMPWENKAISKACLLLWGMYYLLLGGWILGFFGTLIKKTLLEQENFWLITLLLLLLALYQMTGGIECRARVCEVMFWIVVIPFGAMLLLGTSDVSPQQLFPMAAISASGFGKGTYLVFLIFSVSQMLIFSRDALKAGEGSRAAGSAVIFAGALFGVLYEILLGVFGKKTVAALDFPAVTLMSTITLPGNFIHRQDALMVGVWFFALFVLIGSTLFYGSRCVRQLWQPGKKKGRWVTVACAGIVYGIAGLCYLYPKTGYSLLQNFFWYGTPVYLLLPFVLRYIRPWKNSGRKMMALLAAVGIPAGLLFAGCSAMEPEQRSFPMVMGLGEKEGKSCLVYQFEDFSGTDRENSGSSNSRDQIIVSDSVWEEMMRYQQQSHKYIDLNHVKALVMEQDFLEDQTLYEDFLTVLKDMSEISRNTPVFVVADLEQFCDLEEKLEENPGAYLEDMQKDDRSLSSGHQITIGKLLDDWQDQRRNLLLPYLSCEGTQPVVTAYYVVSGGRPAEKIDNTTGELGQLIQGQRIRWEVSPTKQCHITVEQPDVRYEFERADHDTGVLCQVQITGKLQVTGQDGMDEKEAEGYLKQCLEDTLGAYQKNTGCDLTDSFDEMPLYHRELSLDYRGNKENYEEGLQLTFSVDLDLVE